MGETEHIKNLLIKSVEDSKSATQSKYTYVGPRLGVKGAAIQVMDSFISTIIDVAEESSTKELRAQYTLYADEGETLFVINDEPVDYLPPHPVGDFFEAVPDLLMTIIASTDSPGGLSAGKSDAIYAHDSDNEDDVGEIDVYISLPPDSQGIIDYLNDSRLELCGILSHEMQHVVQKMVCGFKLITDADQDLMNHAFDMYEIDARVEESITLMGDDEDESDENLFSTALSKCINNYLDRNTTQEIKGQIIEQMIQDHMVAYKNKMSELI